MIREEMMRKGKKQGRNERTEGGKYGGREGRRRQGS
jgi:hypothetical protein